MNTNHGVGLRVTRIVTLISILCVPFQAAICAIPAEVAGFEGGWGFVTSDPVDSWFGSGFRGGVAVCGAPKQLQIDIREETLPDGSRELSLRLHPDQAVGARITSFSSVRLTTELMDQTTVFEITQKGGLTMTSIGTRLLFTRC